MGRFTSVQGFADNNSNNRTITYDQAKGSNADADNKSQKVVTEKVVNPYGSTSGAGSGEFHVYRHARAREMARWNALDQEAKEKQEELIFRASLDQDKKERETKAEKNRRKRQREKEAKRRKKVLKASGIDLFSQERKKSQSAGEEEFTYIPMAQQEQEQNVAKESKEDTSTAAPSSGTGLAIPNDGSFLEMMKRKLQEEQEKQESETNDKGSSVGGESATKGNTTKTAKTDEESDEEGPALPPILAKK